MSGRRQLPSTCLEPVRAPSRSPFQSRSFCSARAHRSTATGAMIAGFPWLTSRELVVVPCARKSLSWGIPVLESGITLIDDGRFYYRGRDAVALAKISRFEDVVRLLWAQNDRPLPDVAASPAVGTTLARLAPLPVMERLQAILPSAAAGDPAAFDVRPDAVADTGWRSP